jgi:hypothetical protein
MPAFPGGFATGAKHRAESSTASTRGFRSAAGVGESLALERSLNSTGRIKNYVEISDDRPTLTFSGGQNWNLNETHS